MAGIYIHIPFCKQACHYCDFHFSTSLKSKSKLLSAIYTEIDLRKSYLKKETVNTIYFGGGTPSILSKSELETILNKVKSSFVIKPNAEITLEANPDDLNEVKLIELKELGINRLSIGIQSIYDADLQFMNRAHTARQSVNCIKLAKSIGFKNISLDLIYGSPDLTNELWLNQLKEIYKLNIPHISSYALTVEEGTALHKFIEKKKVKPLDEKKASEQFLILMDFMNKVGYEHYEISNFCKPGEYSKHNTSYWQQKRYLGVGPSAHSYNGEQRSWNIANNNKYINAVNDGKSYSESENLTSQNRFNEYIMTSLRTMWGIDLNYLKSNFKDIFFSFDFQTNLNFYLDNNSIVKIGSKIVLTQKGKLIADKIASSLFYCN